MSSTPFDAPLELAPGPSSRAVMALFWVHALPLAVLMAAPLDQWALTALAVAVGLSWLWLRRHPAFGFGPRALVRLRWNEDGSWTVATAAGVESAATLSGSSVVAGALTVLNFDLAGGGRRTRILLGDELAPDLQSRLRARLANR